MAGPSTRKPARGDFGYRDPLSQAQGARYQTGKQGAIGEEKRKQGRRRRREKQCEMRIHAGVTDLQHRDEDIDDDPCPISSCGEDGGSAHFMAPNVNWLTR